MGVFSFTLNGTVFILLGMLLPNAMSASWMILRSAIGCCWLRFLRFPQW